MEKLGGNPLREQDSKHMYFDQSKDSCVQGKAHRSGRTDHTHNFKAMTFSSEKLNIKQITSSHICSRCETFSHKYPALLQ